MIEAAFFGAVVGIVAGLLPGLHTNLLAVFVVLLFDDVWFASVFLISLAVARSVVDAVPAVFLGASEDVMSILPGHKLLMKSHGCEAVKFLVAGSLFGLLISICFIPVFFFVFPFLFRILKPFLFWIVLLLVTILIAREGWKAFCVFFLAGILGLLTLNSLLEPLFPLLSGLFGASGLLLSLLDDDSVPEQFFSDILRLKKSSWLSTLGTGVLAGSVVTLFPGLGPSQAAALVQVKRTKPIKYLVITGAIGTVDVVISLVTFISLGKTRNGAVVALEQLVGSLTPSAFVVLLGAALLSAGLASIVALYFSRFYAYFIDVVGCKNLAVCVIMILAVTSVFLSGSLGLLVFLTASAVGVIAPLIGVSRSHAMGCLLLPTLLVL